MRRLSSNVLLALVVCLLGLTFAPAATSSPRPVAAGQDDIAAIDRLGACLAAGGQGRILLVLDTSASLAQTDPTAGRVTAAQYLVRQLGSYVDTTKAKVDVAIAGFASNFDVDQSWQRLDGSTSASVVSDLDSFRNRDDGFETDYWNAVEGARSYLTSGSAAGTGQCRAWVWFSDGLYDLDKRDTDAEHKAYGLTKKYGPDVELTTDANVAKVQAAGSSDLCRNGGLADQLRTQGIVTLAVGLTSSASTGAVKSDFDLMSGVATGAEASGSRCGDDIDPVPGSFTLASNIGELLFAFDSVSDPQTPPIRQQTPLCQGVTCPEGTHQFVLDDTITKVHILAGADLQGYQVEMVAPGSRRPIELDPGGAPSHTSAAGFTAAVASVSDQDLQIDLTRTAGNGWVGRWQLVFIDPDSSGTGTASSDVHLYGDVEPGWLNQDAPVRVGEPASIQLGLVHAADGSAIDLSTLRSTVALDAAIVYPDGTTLRVASGLGAAALASQVSVDLAKATPGDAVLRLTLTLTTAAARIAGGQTVPGTQLEPSSVDLPITIAAPPNFPIVASSISFGRVHSTDPLSADLPEHGTGCVWLASSKTLTIPENVSTATVSSSAHDASSCVSGPLPLSVGLDAVGNGLASGRLVVMTTSGDNGVRPVPVMVSWQLEVERPRSEVFYPLLVVITAVGILIPIGLLYLVKWRTAKIPGQAVAIGSVRGQVSADSTFLSTASLSEQDLRTVPLEGTGRRSLPLTASATIRTRMGLGPTEPGHCNVEGCPSVSSRAPHVDRRGTSARLPLSIQDSWVALLDAADPGRGDVQVVFLVAPTSGRLPDLIDDARAKLPDLVKQVRARLGDRGAGTPPVQDGGDSWGGDPGGPPGPPGPPSPGADGWGSSVSTPSSGADRPASSYDDW